MSLLRRVFPHQRLRTPIHKIWDPVFESPFQRHGSDLFRDLEEFGQLKAMNVTERKDDVLVEVEVPGLSKENLDLVVRDDTITVTGKMDEASDKDDEKVWAKERYYGEFSRSVQFRGRVIDPAKLSASLENGVLKIILPKDVVKMENGTKVEIS